MKRFDRLLLAATLGIVAQGSAHGENFAYTADARELIGHATVVDARSLAACLHRSVANARCLPASDFLGPHGRLAAFTDIYWLLGTAGIAAKDAVLVVGDNPWERDFVAGMLYLSGQAAVTVLNRPISDGAGLPVSRLGPGTARGMLRQPIYEGTVRADAMVLRSELAAELQRGHSPTLVDGRPESAYWGETIRASRAGICLARNPCPWRNSGRKSDGAKRNCRPGHSWCTGTTLSSPSPISPWPGPAHAPRPKSCRAAGSNGPTIRRCRWTRRPIRIAWRHRPQRPRRLLPSLRNLQERLWRRLRDC